jgi:hypothetical protein
MVMVDPRVKRVCLVNMPSPHERNAIRNVARRLAELMGQPPAKVVLKEGRVDARIEFSEHAFLVEWKPAADFVKSTVAPSSGCSANNRVADSTVSTNASPKSSEASSYLAADAQSSSSASGWNSTITTEGLQFASCFFKYCFGRPSFDFADSP